MVIILSSILESECSEGTIAWAFSTQLTNSISLEDYNGPTTSSTTSFTYPILMQHSLNIQYFNLYLMPWYWCFVIEIKVARYQRGFTFSQLCFQTSRPIRPSVPHIHACLLWGSGKSNVKLMVDALLSPNNRTSHSLLCVCVRIPFLHSMHFAYEDKIMCVCVCVLELS